jgi:hypothetical protein
MNKDFFRLCVAFFIGVTNVGQTHAAASAWPDTPVTLRATPIFQSDRLAAFDFAYSFVAPADNQPLLLALPNEWGGEVALYQAWHEIRVEGAVMSTGAADWQRLLKATPGAQVTLRYRIRDEGTSVRKMRGNDYRPRIADTWFQFLGNAVVPQVTGMPLSTPARFVMEGAPAGFRFASDLEHGAMGRRMNVGDLIESVLVGGDFRVLDAGNGARLAVRGNWS